MVRRATWMLAVMAAMAAVAGAQTPGAASDGAQAQDSPGRSEEQQAGERIVIVGIGAAADVSRALVDAFQQDSGGADLMVDEPETAGTFACLINGTCDVAAVVRVPSAEELGAVQRKTGHELVAVPIALDAVVYFNNPDNPRETLTLDEVSAFMTGRVHTWDELGVLWDRPIYRVIPRPAFGHAAVVEQKLLGGKDSSRTDKHYASRQAVINEIVKSPVGLGYGGLGPTPGVRQMGLMRDAESPAVYATAETVYSREYPIVHYIYWCFAGMPEGTAGDLLEFAVSQRGQEVIRDANLGPLPIQPGEAK